MADFNTPNLCGANEALNNASSKIENLINEIDSKIDAAASEAAAAFESKLTEVKAGLDGLAIDLPEAPAVNFQSEITSLINDVDRTTAQGILSFNAKVAQLKQDFGDTLTEKGLDLNTLISNASTRLGKDVTAVSTTIDDVVTDISGAVTDAYSSVTNAVSGITSNISSGLGVSGVPGNITESISTTTTAVTTGNICDLVPNLEIPSSASGTGITTQEIEERGTGTSVTLTQSPKSIVSVQGKKSAQSFFTNIQYKQNGKVIVPSATGTYSEIKVTYIVSLIKEKPVAAKQADVPPEKEEASIVTTNSNAVDTKTLAYFSSTLKKLNTKSVLGLATEKEKTDLETAISSIGSPTLKSKMDADFAKANAFLSGTGPGTLSGEITSSLNGPVDSNGKSNTIKVTTPESASTVTKEVITKVNPVTKRQETIEVKKTVKAPVSTVGFTNRKVEITEQFYTSTLPSNVDVDIEEMKLIEKGYDLLLKYSPVSIVDIEARAYNSDGINFFLYQFQEGQLKENNVNNIIPAFTPPKNLFLQPKELDSNVLNINVVSITYRILEKLDPSVKG
jgi:hypothetical protein